MDCRAPLSSLFRLTEEQKRALQKLQLSAAKDLLYHFPIKYNRLAEASSIRALTEGEQATIYGSVRSITLRKSFRSKVALAEAQIDDGSATVKAIWFHQPYLAKMFPEGSLVRVSGKVSERNGVPALLNPEIERIPELPMKAKDSLFGEKTDEIFAYPTYPESKGITSRWFFHAIEKLLKGGSLDTLEDPIPKEILERYHLPTLKTALIWIHAPRREEDSEAARKRFAFEEVFHIQVLKQRDRRLYASKEGSLITLPKEELNKFLSRFPFAPTGAQQQTIRDILTDFSKGQPMSRLLEGDVGSGKTLVAATTAYAAVTTRPHKQDFGTLQVAYMAPTEILATQHFESFIEYFKHLPINIALLTGSGCRKFPSKANPGSSTPISRSQLLKWVANGEIAILLGTHALIQKTVRFKHLAYIIIDEQHRFGTRQRMALARKPNADLTPTIADKTPVDPFVFKDLSYRLRGLLFKVKKELGLGHKELVYQNAFAEELKVASISFSREKQIPVHYRGKKVGVYIPDFVIDEKIILEFKSIPFLGQKEVKQLWTYLKGSSYTLALLINFGGRDIEIKRVVYESARSASSLRESASLPHLLSMTATPIPRTLALTIYGDLDLSLLDELPKGRKPVITEIVPPTKRENIYERIRTELKAGRQAYVICPRINEPDPEKELAIEAKSVKAEAARLKRDIFPEWKIGILHSKMKPAEKEKVMQALKDKEVDILVATSVVEVGVNVPNATSIIIEGAERFGLAQLHQLRGRVLRSSHQAYCYLFAEGKAEKTLARLKALVEAKNGFELAELDLKLRGGGELYGRKQWGISDLGMEAIKNLKMVEAARKEAAELVKTDPDLENHPLIRERLEAYRNTLHFE